MARARHVSASLHLPDRAVTGTLVPSWNVTSRSARIRLFLVRRESFMSGSSGLPSKRPCSLRTPTKIFCAVLMTNLASWLKRFRDIASLHGFPAATIHQRCTFCHKRSMRLFARISEWHAQWKAGLLEEPSGRLQLLGAEEAECCARFAAF